MANENTAQLGVRLQVIEWVSCVTAKSAGRRLRWVSSRHGDNSAQCPLYSQQRTLNHSHRMSASGRYYCKKIFGLGAENTFPN